MCVGTAMCPSDAVTTWTGNYCMPTCTPGLEGSGGAPEADDTLEVLDTACASRMSRSGTGIGELGCYEIVLGDTVSCCVPVVDAETCAPDTVVMESPDPSAASLGALRCSPKIPGGIGWLESCTAGFGYVCEEGDCLQSPGGSWLCTLPCVAVGSGSVYSGCPADHVCASRGWGMIGVCLPGCPGGVCASWGTTCVEDGWPEPYCVQ